MLVIADQLTGWIEAFPTRKNDLKAVVKALLKEINLRYGVPEVIDSDQGSNFSAALLIQVYGISWGFSDVFSWFLNLAVWLKKLIVVVLVVTTCIVCLIVSCQFYVNCCYFAMKRMNDGTWTYK